MDVEQLHTIATTTDVHRRKLALRLAGRLGTPALPILLEALKDENAEMREQAVIALQESRVPAVMVGLRNALQDRHPKVRGTAIKALGERQDREAVWQILELLGDHDLNTACLAAEALGRIGAIEAAPGLIEKLKTGPLEMRLEAAHALGRIGGAGARAALEHAARDEDKLVQIAAANAVQMIQEGVGIGRSGPKPPSVFLLTAVALLTISVVLGAYLLGTRRPVSPADNTEASFDAPITEETDSSTGTPGTGEIITVDFAKYYDNTRVSEFAEPYLTFSSNEKGLARAWGGQLQVYGGQADLSLQFSSPVSDVQFTWGVAGNCASQVTFTLFNGPTEVESESHGHCEGHGLYHESIEFDRLEIALGGKQDNADVFFMNDLQYILADDGE